MPTTGITVADDAVQQFNNMKLTSTPGKQLLVLYIVNSQIEVSEEDSADICDNDGLINFLTSSMSKAAYVLHDFAKPNGGKKLICMMWAPEGTNPSNNKMIYATTFSVLKSTLDGVAKFMEFQPSSASEVTFAEINDKL